MGPHDQMIEYIGYVRKAQHEVGEQIGILADLQGPKIRLGQVQEWERAVGPRTEGNIYY